MNSEYKNGKMTDEEFWNWAASEWQLSISGERLIQILIDGYEIDKDVSDVVKKLRTKGYMTAICSNNFPARIDGLLKKFNFLNDFDIKVLSYEVGVSKPDTKIFDALVKKSGVVPEAIVFADDNQANLEGAKQLGITTFLYEGFDNYLKQLRDIGVEI
jgi:putative hydrolase of the HAD superfamily